MSQNSLKLHNDSVEECQGHCKNYQRSSENAQPCTIFLNHLLCIIHCTFCPIVIHNSVRLHLCIVACKHNRVRNGKNYNIIFSHLYIISVLFPFFSAKEDYRGENVSRTMRGNSLLFRRIIPIIAVFFAKNSSTKLQK